MIRSIASIALLASLAACSMAPPAPVAPRSAQPVQASFGRTWDAVIDVFAAQNLPIRNMERASGFISSEAALDPAHSTALADCGKAFGMPLNPSRAVYNVLVRGDSSSSTVKVTVLYTLSVDAEHTPTTCSTKGVWEGMIESQVRDSAQAMSARASR